MTRAARKDDRTWASHPVRAAAIRVLAFVIPLVVSMLVGLAVSRSVTPAESLGGSVFVGAGVRRLDGRPLRGGPPGSTAAPARNPDAAVHALPGPAPSRIKVARGSPAAGDRRRGAAARPRRRRRRPAAGRRDDPGAGGRPGRLRLAHPRTLRAHPAVRDHPGRRARAQQGGRGPAHVGRAGPRHRQAQGPAEVLNKPGTPTDRGVAGAAEPPAPGGGDLRAAQAVAGRVVEGDRAAPRAVRRQRAIPAASPGKRSATPPAWSRSPTSSR